MQFRLAAAVVAFAPWACPALAATPDAPGGPVAADAAVVAPAAPAAPAKWSDTLKLGLQLEGGLTGNPSSPRDNLNYGHLFTDRANEPVLNQALITLGRPVDPKATGYDVGFKLQLLYGTDARYTHLANMFDKVTRGRYQTDINEASVTAHAPWLTEGGVDLQAGIFPSPLGFETIDPSTNPFYSHSYIFNFGLPFKHTGATAIVHATPMLDVYAGVTSGTNTFVGSGDNNAAAALIAGLKLTFLDGNLTFLALSHIGPESAKRAVPQANGAYRYYNDGIITWKATEKLTLTTELNYVRDDFARAEAFGIAQYAAYPITGTVTLNGRAEVFRDTRGFFVAAFPTAQGSVLALEGFAVPTVSYGATTYGSLTLGATWKPAVPGFIENLLIRPEIRYDTVIDGGRRYNAGRDRNAVTLSTDVVIAF